MDRAEIIALAKSKFVPIQPPIPSPEAAQPALATIHELRPPLPQGPRFDYDNYMKNLNQKIQGNGPNSSANIGTNFQEFIMREREQFKNSVYTLEKESPMPILTSINKYNMETANRKHGYSPDPYSSAGGHYGRQSANSLQYMS